MTFVEEISNSGRAAVSIEELLGALLRSGPTLQQRLAALRDYVPGRLVFTTSFGVEDQAIAHAIFAAGIDVEVVTLDTGRLFPETYQLWADTEQRYGVRIRSFHPNARALSRHVADAGINGFYYSREARQGCCHVRKVEPLGRARGGATAWVTGLRAGQSGARASVPLASFDPDKQLIKIAPLFDWSREQVVEFCTANNVPTNALHAQGYLSIGCQPCTRALQPGEPERAGRWWWENEDSKECGLHVSADGALVRSKAA
jgi:phosphoadenosine phosphosulfate reductase